MMRRFQRYAAKVFDLPALVARLRDPRRAPPYSTAHVWQSVATLLATGRTSLHAIEADRRRERDVLWGSGAPSDDTLGRVFAQLDPEPLRQMLVAIQLRLKRNKVLPLAWNLRFAAVDGHEFFRQPPAALRRLSAADADGRRTGGHRILPPGGGVPSGGVSAGAAA